MASSAAKLREQVAEIEDEEFLPGNVLHPIRREPTRRRILTFDIETDADKWRTIKRKGSEKVEFQAFEPYAIGLSFRLPDDNWKVGEIAGADEEACVLFKGTGRDVMIDFLRFVLTPEFANEWIWAHNFRGFDSRFLVDAMEDPWFTANFRARFIETRAGVTAIDVEPLKREPYRSARTKKAKKIYWRFCDSLQVVRLGLGSKGEAGVTKGANKWRPGFAATFGGLAQAVQRQLKAHKSMDGFKYERPIRYCYATHTKRDGQPWVEFSTVEKYVSTGDKDKLDHELGSKDPRWPSYLANDASTLRWGLEGLQDIVIDQGGQLDITIAAMSMFWFRRSHYNPGKEGDGQRWINQNLEHEDFFRGAVSGGRTEILRMKGEGLVYIDYNGLYPTIAASEPMPIGEAFEATGVQTHEDVFRYLAAHPSLIGFIHCDVEVPDDVEIPPLGVKHEVDGVPKYIFATGRLRGTWTTHELALLDEIGGRIAKIHRALWQTTAITFHDYVAACRQLRKRGEDEGIPGLSQLGKDFGNNFVGKFSMRRERASSFMDPALTMSGEQQNLDRFRHALKNGMHPDLNKSQWRAFQDRSQHVERCEPCFTYMRETSFRDWESHENNNLTRYRADLLRFLKFGGERPKKTVRKGRNHRAILGRFIHECRPCVEKIKAGYTPPKFLSPTDRQEAECQMCYGTGAWRGQCPKCSDTGLWLNLTPYVERPAGANFYRKDTIAGNVDYIIPAINATVCSIARVRWWRTAMAVVRATGPDGKKLGGFVAYGDTDSHIIGGITVDRLKYILPIYRYDEAPGVQRAAPKLGLSRRELTEMFPELSEEIMKLSPLGREPGQSKVEHDRIASFDALRPKLYGFTCEPGCVCGDPGDHAATKGFGRGFAPGSGDWKKDAVENYAILRGQGTYVEAHQFLSWKLGFERALFTPGVVKARRGLNGKYDKRKIQHDGATTTPLKIDMWSQPFDHQVDGADDEDDEQLAEVGS